VCGEPCGEEVCVACLDDGAGELRALYYYEPREDFGHLGEIGLWD